MSGMQADDEQPVSAGATLLQTLHEGVVGEVLQSDGGPHVRSLQHCLQTETKTTAAHRLQTRQDQRRSQGERIRSVASACPQHHQPRHAEAVDTDQEREDEQR